MNILFFGSSDFSYVCVQTLMKKHKVIGIITQPDNINKKICKEPYLKTKMKNTGIPIYQPENIKNEFKLIKEIHPDIIVTAAYGQILPKEILEYPKYKSINIHASYLPDYRGASPIKQAIIDGKEYTGLTAIYMDENIDTGDIIVQEKIYINDNETGETLYNKFLNALPDFIEKTMESIINGAPAKKQGEPTTPYTCKYFNKNIYIDWSNTPDKIDRIIRAYSPSGVQCYIGGQKFKIYQVTPINVYHENKPGTLIRIGKDFIRIACKNGYIDIYQIQTPGKRILDTKEFINGRKKWLKEIQKKY